MSISNSSSTKEVLKQVSTTLRALVEEKEKLASQLETYQKRAQAEEIVSAMDNKGLSDPNVPFQDKVDMLINSDKDLNVVKEAMSLAAADFSFASVSEDGNETSHTAFEDFILGS
jgi:hypothetical protein